MSIITLDHISKRYRLSQLGARSLREEVGRRLGRNGAHGEEEFYALRDVSLAVAPGEAVGFIGPNGSGKSTILKLLARIIHPTSGRVAVRGSVASLIEVGAGFHPELTGRENIFLYGSIMGMRQADIRARFDEIVSFAELEQFIDTPVKRYSSGMYVRLGFAVAAHIHPDVLLVDEVLAVGDAAFQSKCQQRIEALQRDGMTIVFVSHDMGTVERLCRRVFFMQKGRVAAEGDAQTVIGRYYDAVASKAQAQAGPGAEAAGERAAEIVDVQFFTRDGAMVESLATGQTLVARIAYRTARRTEEPVFDLLFYAADDRLHCHFTTAQPGEPLPALTGNGVVEITCDALGLTPGVYKVDAWLGRRGSRVPYDWKPRRYLLRVTPGLRVRGLFYSPHRWRLLPAPAGERAEVQNRER